MRWNVSTAVVALLVLSVVAAKADVFCQKKSGAVAIRTTCKKKETQVDLAAFGAIGPKGDRGDPGTPGNPGTPGTPGAAVAYAHVLANGTVDAANSKNVASANVSLDTLTLNSAFCFHGLTFTFNNVTAVAEWGGLATSGSFAQTAVGDPAGDCSSAAQAIVVTQNGSGFTPTSFYIIFN